MSYWVQGNSWSYSLVDSSRSHRASVLMWGLEFKYFPLFLVFGESDQLSSIQAPLCWSWSLRPRLVLLFVSKSTVNPPHWLPWNISIQDFLTNLQQLSSKVRRVHVLWHPVSNPVESCGTQDLNLNPVSQFQITLAKIKAVTEMPLSRQHISVYVWTGNMNLKSLVIEVHICRDEPLVAFEVSAALWNKVKQE